MCSWGFWGLGIRFCNQIYVFQLPLWCNTTLIMDKCWGCYRLNTQPNFMILGLPESYRFCVHSALVKCNYIMHAEPIYWALAYWMLFPCSWFTCLYGWYYCTIKYLMICSVYLQSMSGFHHHLIEEERMEFTRYIWFEEIKYEIQLCLSWDEWRPPEHENSSIITKVVELTPRRWPYTPTI